MRGRLGELRRAPWTLWVYLGLSAVVAVAASVLGNPAYLWFLPISLALEVVFAFFLLGGSRVMWWVLFVLELGAIPFYVTGDLGWRAPVTVIALGLLLAPPSRRYVFKPKPAQEEKFTATREPGKLGPQTSWDPDAHDDATRPPGWYFDPAEPTRLRYWNPALGGWQSKTTRAPRKLRRRSGDAAAD